MDWVKTDIYFLRVLLAASKNAITKCWLEKNSPTTHSFVNIVKQLHVLLTQFNSKNIWVKNDGRNGMFI